MFKVEVLIEHPVQALDRGFSYLSKKPILTGIRVQVPFNHRQVVGYVLSVEEVDLTQKELEERDGFKYSYIYSVIDEAPLLNNELITLAHRMSKMTLCPLIACFQAMLPGTLKPSTHKMVGIKTITCVRVINTGTPKTTKQQEAFRLLVEKGEMFLKDIPYSRSVITSLEKQGLVEVYNKEVQRDPYAGNNLKINNKITLTPLQTSVVEGVLETSQMISLIHGVTGSGKTEVYIALTKKMLEENKTVLMLVPEISLTPMMERVFKERFHDEVAIIHSRLSQGEKYDEYRRIKKGEARIVVGARSAIFAPVENLGLIIMDEEHDMSYKQDNTPRYHTLSIAKMRAEKNHAKIVLGSATPSVETYARAKKGIYSLFEMKQRINGKPLPYCEVVDMGNESRQGNYSLMSRRMKQRLQETLDKKEQAMILLNKRGYASFIKCESCNEPIRCPHCDVTLTYHKPENRLKCHLCEYFIPTPRTCPNCGSTHLKKIGYGTQKIEEELEKQYPEAHIIRFDFDTTRNKNTHLKLLKDFEEHKADIMLGTQMIAKGLDFSNVTFVGVLMADLSLMVPDFRASERTFQLLCQVAGRSGRGEKQGTVMIQTFNPEHYAIKAAVKQDYDAFFKEEIAFRKKAKYPPYCHLVSVIVQSRTSKNVHSIALDISQYLRDHLEKVRIIGPQSTFKMQDIYRERILIKYIESKPIYEQLSIIDDYYNRTRKGGVIVACDFNPYSTY